MEKEKSMSSLFLFIPGMILFGIGAAAKSFIIMGIAVLIFIIGLINNNTWKFDHGATITGMGYDEFIAIIYAAVIMYFVVLVLKILKIL